MKSIRKITGEYIAGFVDGEGCFSLTYRKDKGKYFYWKASFAVALRKDDKNILESIREYFCDGAISYSRENVRFEIANPDVLSEKNNSFF
ncbi:MAG: LAGLIDADG family homing endonuclease [Patescibacteria group bacterium]|nr:LAGLIDADG family homing endonuclease [Patescibacteria group bacterium]